MVVILRWIIQKLSDGVLPLAGLSVANAAQEAKPFLGSLESVPWKSSSLSLGNLNGPICFSCQVGPFCLQKIALSIQTKALVHVQVKLILRFAM